MTLHDEVRTPLGECGFASRCCMAPRWPLLHRLLHRSLPADPILPLPP